MAGIIERDALSERGGQPQGAARGGDDTGREWIRERIRGMDIVSRSYIACGGAVTGTDRGFQRVQINNAESTANHHIPG